MRARRAVALAALLGVLGLPATAGAHGSAPDERRSGAAAEGLADSVPPAARAAEPTLPAPAAWPFGEAFPRTSGTGRLADGALLWSDFLYDDHGAAGLRGSSPYEEYLATWWPQGTYSYADEAARNNGADLFRAGVGTRGGDSWWRVDWNTLADPSVPVAAFGLDTDADPGTGQAAWPAGAGVSSAGLDRVLVVSGAGAWLVDPASGERSDVVAAGGQHVVDLDARSFVVRVPAAVLRPEGTWSVRLVAGVADAAGTGFAPVSAANGALPGQPAVYNVGFRTFEQELASADGGPWNSDAQAASLAARDVSPYAVGVDWDALADGASTPEPLPTGHSVRWYVSSIEVDEGGVARAAHMHLGRVQPYTVYVPTDYDGSEPRPLTWLLHSAGSQHNQFTASAITLTLAACEERGAICATTLGRGESLSYQGPAEVDFWQVWGRLADSYRLDPDRTAIGGISMGGLGSIRFTQRHPDLFTHTLVITGAGGDDPKLENVREVPQYFASGGPADLAFRPSMAETAALEELGYRYRWDASLLQDHIVTAMRGGGDDFAAAAAYLGDPSARRVTDPGRVVFRWDPSDEQPEHGVVHTGAYWVTAVEPADATSDTARIEAVSGMRPAPAVAVVTDEQLRPTVPSPTRTREVVWEPGDAPAATPELDLARTNVGAVTLDLARAGLAGAGSAALRTEGDGATRLTLTGLRPGTRVAAADGTAQRAGGDGTVTLVVPAGRVALTLTAPGR